MCGISAVFALKPEARLAKNAENQLNASLDRIAHRGPDSRGLWISEDRRVALAHCRLSIIDLSPDGDQPLQSDDGLIHAVVNGEIYEYARIREELVRDFGYHFKGQSDSELVVALYKHYGLSFLSRLRGEFSFCLYDEQNQTFLAARDRFGIKPLFWTVVDDRLLVAAEIKALVPLGWKPEWDIRSIADGGWNFGDRTHFLGVRKILPGHSMTCLLSGYVDIQKYWDAEYVSKDRVETRTEAEMIQGVRAHLLEAIRLRLRADVPVGVYLSGGLDSSAIAGIVKYLVHEQGEKMGSQEAVDRVCCFSVQFEASSGFDESEIAARTAKWLGVRHIKRMMDETELARNFEDAIYHCEATFPDLGIVGKYCLSEKPREEGYKVVLTGEGSDEHFAGYPTFVPDYLKEPDLNLPDSPLSRDAELRKKLHDESEQVLIDYMKGYGGNPESWPKTGVASRQLNNTITPPMMYAFHPPPSIFEPWVRRDFGGVDYLRTVVNTIDGVVRGKIMREWHPMHTAQYSWIKGHLANFLLVALGDRTEMAHSIEARPPFLDHDLVEYANHLPPSMKLKYVAPPMSSQGGEEGLGGTAAAQPAKEKCTGTQTNGTGPASTGQSNVSNGGGSSSGSSSTTKPMTNGAAGSGDGKGNSKDGGKFVEKWILREACKPFITQEIYERRKHPYTAPFKYAVDGPMHRLFSRLLSRENLEALGFVDRGAMQDVLDRAFVDPRNGEGEGKGKGDVYAFKLLCMVAGWVVLSKRFDVPRASSSSGGGGGGEREREKERLRQERRQEQEQGREQIHGQKHEQHAGETNGHGLVDGKAEKEGVMNPDGVLERSEACIQPS